MFRTIAILYWCNSSDWSLPTACLTVPPSPCILIVLKRSISIDLHWNSRLHRNNTPLCCILHRTHNLQKPMLFPNYTLGNILLVLEKYSHPHQSSIQECLKGLSKPHYPFHTIGTFHNTLTPGASKVYSNSQEIGICIMNAFQHPETVTQIDLGGHHCIQETIALFLQFCPCPWVHMYIFFLIQIKGWWSENYWKKSWLNILSKSISRMPMECLVGH